MAHVDQDLGSARRFVGDLQVAPINGTDDVEPQSYVPPVLKIAAMMDGDPIGQFAPMCSGGIAG